MVIKRLALFAIINLPFILACSSTNPNFTDCIKDPFFNFKEITSVGLIPVSWTEYGKSLGIDPLQEKMLQSYMMNEFRFIKVRPVLLPKGMVFLSGDTIRIVENKYKDLDAIVFMYFNQKNDSIWIPSQSSGYFSLNSYFGIGGYSRVDAHQKNMYRIGITLVMLMGKPYYKEKIWEGRLLRTSQEPDLNKCGECLISELFTTQYPHKKYRNYHRIRCYNSMRVN